MLTRLAITTVKVLDQDEALDFYVTKLGLEVGQDVKRDGFRWLTVRVPGDPVEIVLEQPGPPTRDEATAAELRELITRGAMDYLLFHTDDARGLYETLRGRGVTTVTQAPTERPYGIDLRLRDPSGNDIRILQPAPAVDPSTA
jgi:catechol 2,3-dioxygenase-like lactoylglutathione lyase family enzyme